MLLDVFPKIAVVGEVGSADAALVRFFARVRPHVHLEVVGPLKALAASDTLVGPADLAKRRLHRPPVHAQHAHALWRPDRARSSRVTGAGGAL